jgi:mRNA-degrading endonuclease toxin of MazEF toxin-antitoxin module
MKLKRGMIIDVNLDPTLGSETGKIRPCIIVTNNTYNERVLVISQDLRSTAIYGAKNYYFQDIATIHSVVA